MSPDEETKYIVFESCLLLLFTTCPSCNQKVEPTNQTLGTLLRVTQFCEECEYYRKWDSQPFINNVPAGNLLLSASILFAGTQPTKILKSITVSEMGLNQTLDFLQTSEIFFACGNF